MLEIGYLMGESHRMWLQYFAKGDVFFMEKDGNHNQANGFGGDQGIFFVLGCVLLDPQYLHLYTHVYSSSRPSGYVV